MSNFDIHFSRLTALKQNLPTENHIEEVFVSEYKSILKEIEKETGLDLNLFDIPFGQLAPVPRSSNYLNGEVKYSTKKFCSRSFLLMKLDGILNLFSIRSSSETEIGFRSP